MICYELNFSWSLHSLKTELRGSVARSWLRVSQAGRRDSGVYYCNVTNLAAASVTIHVVPGECVSCWLCLALMLFPKHATIASREQDFITRNDSQIPK